MAGKKVDWPADYLDYSWVVRREFSLVCKKGKKKGLLKAGKWEHRRAVSKVYRKEEKKEPQLVHGQAVTMAMKKVKSTVVQLGE
jgi:hypothetical protein